MTDMRGAGPAAARIGAGAALVFVVLVALVPSLLHDPYIRSDEYSVLLGEADRYWLKTLEEGRWLNWLWTLRPGMFGAVANTVAFLIAWAVFAAAAAYLLLRGDRRLWRTLLLALAIGLAPQIAQFAGWPSTTLPFLSIAAIFALLGAVLSARTMVRLLWVFVPLCLMAYTTGPLVLLLVAAICHGEEARPREAWRLAGVFVGAYLIGALAIFSLNWAFHGQFAILIADWRNPAPVSDVASLVRNIGVAARSVAQDFRQLGILDPRWVFGVLALVLCALAVGLRRGGRGMVFWVAAALTIAVSFAIVVRNGIATPPRASLYLYLVVVFGFGLAASDARLVGRYLWPAAALIVALPGALIWVLSYAPLVAAQNESREMVAALRAAGSDTAPGIRIVGEPLATPAGGIAHGPEKLGYRLFLQTGRPIRICEEDDPACADSLERAKAAPVWPEAGSILRAADGALILNLPRADPAVPGRPLWTREWTEDGGIGAARPE